MFARAVIPALVLAVSSIASAAEPLPACVAPPAGRTIPFSLGERIELEIDSVGATVGTFSMTVAPGRGDDRYLVLAKAKTGTFAGSFYPVEASAEARIGRKMESRQYVEDATENGVRRTVDVRFPVPKEGKLPVRASKQGNKDDFQLNAPEDTRDMLSALYMVRGIPLKDGEEICIPIFGARRIWHLRAKVAGREPVRTPLGDFQTVHIEGVAIRTDYPKMQREVHFWLTDDATRVPVAAFGLVQNKPVRAQLVKYEPGRRVAQSPLR